MRVLLLLICLWPPALFAHPGIGMVKDSKGTIYYTDLHDVWKISKGHKSIAVPNVHTHELYLDSQDNLYGEDLQYDGDARGTFHHSLWVLRPGGTLDTVIAPRQAYVHTDYSLARDKDGNEYFLQFVNLKQDTTRIYKRGPNGKESVIARGNFSGVKWLHPQADGSLLYIQDNNVYRIHPTGTVSVIARHIANAQPSFPFPGKGVMAWGAWQDKKQNVYVAIFSDAAIKKIDPRGVASEYYHSKEGWTPLYGVFDDEGKLWVMECNRNNEVQVVREGAPVIVKQQHHRSFPLLPYAIGACALLILSAYWIFWKSRRIR